MSQLRLDGGADDARPVSLRDLNREHDFLLEVSHGRDSFVEEVEQRLAARDEIYSDSWAWIGVKKLLQELEEEAADLAAWRVPCLQAIDRDTQLTDLHREQLRAVLTNVARHGAQADEGLEIALRSVERLQR